jgi:hypothetical protein
VDETVAELRLDFVKIYGAGLVVAPPLVGDLVEGIDQLDLLLPAI